MLFEPTRAFFATALAMAPVWAAASAATGTTLDQARELHRAGKLEASAGAYREVLEDSGLDEPSRAIAHNNLCVVLDALGELAAAETACRAALELRRKLSDPLRLARTLNNLGLVLQHRGRYGEAEAQFSEALAVNRELEEPYGQAINLANLGAVATLAGRFQEALDRQVAVRELAAIYGEEPWAIEQARIAELNRGVVLERLGAYREALDVYADLLGAETPGGGVEVRPEEEASILVNSGVIYRNLGDPVEAIERFEAAASRYRELADPAGLAHVELNLGIARHLNLGDLVGAEAAYRRALDLVKDTGDRGIAIEALGFLGRLLLTRGHADEARARLEEGLALAHESGSAEGVWATTAALGEVERAQGELDAALGRYEQAIDEIEAGRAGVGRAEYRASFFADKRTVYSGALVTLAEMDRREGGVRAPYALEIAQQAKARDLLDALGLRESGRERPVAPMRPLKADEIARRLGEDVLVEYFVADSELFLWTVRDGAIRLVGLGDPAPVLEAVGKLHRHLSNGSEPPSALVDYLSSQLLGSLEELPEATRLWIAPDRRLRYVPFEILPVPVPVPGPGSREDRELLIDRAQVSYLPSAWALPDGLERPRASRSELGFLGFGAAAMPVAFPYPSWVSRLDLEPLPAARRELESAARRIPGEHRVLLGPDATEASFREHAGRTGGVIHFATHAPLVEQWNRGSAILLTPGGGDDGMLTPDEIAATSIEPDLVVLAACATALGGRQDGRALTTLTGAFLAAGARAVLATLWPVGDQGTEVFMEQFYYQLSRGLAPAEALRRTKLRFRADERWRGSWLWSGYVLMGSAPAVAPGRDYRVWLGALALALTLAGLAVRARTRGEVRDS